MKDAVESEHIELVIPGHPGSSSPVRRGLIRDTERVPSFDPPSRQIVAAVVDDCRHESCGR